MSTRVRPDSLERRLGQAVEEFLRMRGRPNPSGALDSRVPGEPASPGPTIHLKAIDYPDGRVGYPELGILCDSGETLFQALASRKRELLAELFQRAMVPSAFRMWTFDTFPVDRGKAMALRMARAYARAGTGNLMLVGATGTGKTGLAICILRARLEQGVPSLYVSVPDLLDRIRSTFDGHGDYEQLMETVKTVDFLALDDLGAHHATDWAREKLFQIFGHRHDWLLPTVITSDRPLAELEMIIGRRILARIIEYGEVVEVGGRDLRMWNQKDRHDDAG